MLDTNIINREASDKTKGFRLQKLRAANLALNEIEKGTSEYFYIAIEQGEDVAKISSDERVSHEYYEEDKDYPTSNFTLNSHAVKNTLVSFYDLYVTRWRQSNNICFGFYTTAKVGKEQDTDATKKIGIQFPDQKLLDLVAEKTLDDSVVNLVKKLLTLEYEKQYKDKKSKGNLEQLKKINVSDFRSFLKSIRWYFGQGNNADLKEGALKKIVASKFYNFRLEGKESYILSEILDVIEERQHNPNYSDRFIDRFQIELIFNKAESVEVDLKNDVAWKNWDEISIPGDTRNLKEKIYAVCEGFSEKEIGRLTRRACSAKIEEKESGKDYLSLKYRVLEACEEVIYEEINGGNEISSDKVSKIIGGLKDQAIKSIEELRKDYHYPIKNSHSIKSIVLDLFDSCYLAFDES